MTDDLWQRVINITRSQNSTLAALLRDAKPVEVTGNKIVLGVKFPFHKDKISERKNLDILEKVFGDLVGGSCTVNCQINKNSVKKNVKSSPDDNLVKAAEEIFN